MSAKLESLLASAERKDGVYYLSDPQVYVEQEDYYWRVRARENRLYPDEVVRTLPEIAKDHPLVKEWGARADSLGRLADYVARRQHGLDVLDLGCGNGWMAHQLAALPNVRVYGLDLNRRELTQAARVFVERPRLKFIYGDVFSAPLPLGTFHMIVAASVIQYFSDLPALVRRLLALCAPGDEVHVLDSPLYAASELVAAQQRTREYYTQKGLAFMTEAYHHHLRSALTPFNPDVLYNPRAPLNRLAQWWWGEVPRSPFLWLKVTAPIQTHDA
ncbi:MAG: class I SAM-dependent methyltransferase [Anaerolineales bacterium]